MSIPVELSDSTDPVQIKKYPNRRYYDATRSRHVTLQDLHELIRSGTDIRVTDSRSGADITNLVLLQILLEKEAPTLNVFPPALVHEMIRRKPQALRESFERVWSPFANLLSASQDQIDAFWRAAVDGGVTSPLEWPGSLMKRYSSAARGGESAGPEPPPATLDELRHQAAELTRRIEGLESTRPPADS